jgi:hypothetical protein
MKKLNLPIIRGKMAEPKTLSMDDYLKFVEFNLKYTVDIEAVRQRKRMMAVNVPFSLRKR